MLKPGTREEEQEHTNLCMQHYNSTMGATYIRGRPLPSRTMQPKLFEVNTIAMATGRMHTIEASEGQAYVSIT